MPKRNIWSRILFTFGAVLVVLLGSFTLLPDIDKEMVILHEFNFKPEPVKYLSSLFKERWGLYTIFSLGLTPYFLAIIIMNLLKLIVPRLRRFFNSGLGGKD